MKFQKLEVWQLSYELSSSIYIATKDLRDWGFRDQITRSGLSVPSNIAEGMERYGPKEQIQFLYVAKASLAELITQAMIGRDIGYLEPNYVDELLIKTERLSAMLAGLIKSIKDRNSENK
ncbi:four helix bundle protein [Shewanella putrefaciens]|uniref:four helix bundle protein n=1 Tax=Shewanella putrefaciens TaxID=24 RepID=UPI0018E72CB6|nr:four helix bundle protein [Shewanella putrefaciens]